MPKRRTPSPASPPHLLTNAGERYALLGGPMVRSLYWLILAVFPFSICMNITAADSVSAANTTCNFDRNTQIAVDYEQFQLAAGNKAHATPVSYGTVWAPGGKPLTLFTNTPVSVGGEQLADGAYTMFIVPREKSWTLIISTSTDTSGKYDKNDDLARIPMGLGKLPSPEPEFSAYFAQAATKQCDLRLDLGKDRAWVAFKRKSCLSFLFRSTSRAREA